MRRYCLLVFIAISACSENQIKPEPVPGPDTIAQCDETQRDLTLSWKQRQYWCAQELRKSPVQVQNHIIKLESLQHSRSEILSIKKSLDKLVLNKKDGRIPKEMIGIEQSYKPSSINYLDKKNIIFAKRLEILGPKGRLMVKSVAAEILNANHITIRGYIDPTEFGVLKKSVESFSVGRALTVKNHLVKHGIDKNKLTILHHKNELPGSYVEVVVNG